MSLGQYKLLRGKTTWEFSINNNTGYVYTWLSPPHEKINVTLRIIDPGTLHIEIVYRDSGGVYRLSDAIEMFGLMEEYIRITNILINANWESHDNEVPDTMIHILRQIGIR